MGKPYSIDLRERVVASVLEGGLSRNKAAAYRDVESAPTPFSDLAEVAVGEV